MFPFVSLLRNWPQCPPCLPTPTTKIEVFMSPSQTICLNPPCHPSPTTNIEFFLLSAQTICSNKSMYFTRSVYMSFFEILLRNGPQIRPGSLFYLPQRTICLNKTMAFFFGSVCVPLCIFCFEIGSNARPATLPPRPTLRLSC